MDKNKMRAHSGEGCRARQCCRLLLCSPLSAARSAAARSLPQTEHFWGLRKVDSRCQCWGRTYNLQVRKSPSTWYLIPTFSIFPYSHVGGSWIACIRLDILRSKCQARIKAIRILLVEVPEWKKYNENQRKLEEYHQNATLTLNNGQKEQIGRKHPRLPCNSRKLQQNLWEVLGPTGSWQSSPIFPWTALAPLPQVVTGRGQPTGVQTQWWCLFFPPGLCELSNLNYLVSA